jgi:hypothetical protein
MITDTALHRYRHYHAPGVRLSSLAWRVNWIGARRSCGLSQTADVANAVAGVAKKTARSSRGKRSAIWHRGAPRDCPRQDTEKGAIEAGQVAEGRAIEGGIMAERRGSTAAGFEAWKKQFADEARGRGVSASTVAALMATTYSTATIAADRGQSSICRSIRFSLSVAARPLSQAGARSSNPMRHSSRPFSNASASRRGSSWPFGPFGEWRRASGGSAGIRTLCRL